MDDREYEDLVSTMRQSHHVPPEAPADRMWERIAAARSERRRPQRGWPWWQAGLAAAAVLVVGIAIGRFGVRPDAGPAPAADLAQPTSIEPTPDTPPVQPLVRYAAVSLFHRADALLTDLQSGDPARTDLAPLPAWAGGMLAQTRLLLDTNLADDPDTRALLLDLELLLARIASLSPAGGADDVDRIRQDLKDTTTLDRLRLAGADRRDSRLL